MAKTCDQREQGKTRCCISPSATKRGIDSPTILEWGIDSGRIAKPFVNAGLKYIGIDRSEAMPAECRANLVDRDNLVIIEAD
jgi:SAM-dependent methyltransferase